MFQNQFVLKSTVRRAKSFKLVALSLFRTKRRKKTLYALIPRLKARKIRCRKGFLHAKAYKGTPSGKKHFMRLFLSLADRTEELHFFLYGSLDCFKAGSKELSGVEALSFSVLAGLDVGAGSFLESKLTLGVNVDLGNA